RCIDDSAPSRHASETETVVESELADALADLYERIAQSDPPPDADQHLRFASDLQGFFRGSDWGASVWNSPQGRSLQGLLLADPKLAEMYAPPPPSRLQEMRGRIASFLATTDAAQLPASIERVLPEL